MFFHKVHAAIIKIANCFSELALNSSVLVLICSLKFKKEVILKIMLWILGFWF